MEDSEIINQLPLWLMTDDEFRRKLPPPAKVMSQNLHHYKNQLVISLSKFRYRNNINMLVSGQYAKRTNRQSGLLEFQPS